MSVKLSSILPLRIKTPRLTLERYDSGEQHVRCCLEARNNAFVYAQVGDLGCHDQAELERRHNGPKISKDEFGLDVDIDVDAFVLYLLRVDVGEDGSPLVGFIHVHQFPDSTPELGYNVIPEFMGKGYATEAVVGMCGVARETLGMGRLAISVRQVNVASRRVAEKAGFVSTGQTKVKSNGTVMDYLELPMDKP